jgi:hypothetical protein
LTEDIGLHQLRRIVKRVPDSLDASDELAVHDRNLKLAALDGVEAGAHALERDQRPGWALVERLDIEPFPDFSAK